MKPDLFRIEDISKLSKINPVPEDVKRPLFSVMIPVCNRTKYLRQTIESVLQSNYSSEQMQICIVDNSTEKIDWVSLLSPLEFRRIELFTQDKHVSMVENWNTCIIQARGHLVHILHDDDWVMRGFYEKLTTLSNIFPDCKLIATRSFFTDNEGHFSGVTRRVKSLEQASHNIEAFHTGNPLQCASVVIRREFYEQEGGFHPKLVHTADWEMWLRAISKGSGVMVPDVLAAYRVFPENDTGRLMRTAENLRDRERSIAVAAAGNIEFNAARARSALVAFAFEQYRRFEASGDNLASRAALDFWWERAKSLQKMSFLLKRIKAQFRDGHGH